MNVHESYYSQFRYIYEVFIVSVQTLEKQSLGFMDGVTYEEFMPGFMLWLQDHKQFYWSVKYHIVNEHTDDYMGRADNFIHQALNWQTDYATNK